MTAREIRITFQGGFVGMNCELLVVKQGQPRDSFEPLTTFQPRDSSEEQVSVCIVLTLLSQTL